MIPDTRLIDIEPDRAVATSPTAIETIALTSSPSPSYSGFSEEKSW